MNYDIASIFCDNLKNRCKNVPENILKQNYILRDIIIMDISWNPTKHSRSQFIPESIYKFNGGSIYDPNNWQLIKKQK